MAVLAGLIGLVGFLFLLVALIGVIAPSVFKDKKTGEVPKRSHLLLGGVVASVIAFLVAGAVAPEGGTGTDKAAANDKDKVVVAVPDQAPKTTPAEKSLGMNPEVWRAEFNRIIGRINQDYKIAELDIGKGDVNDTFKRMMSDNIGLIGTVSKKDGSLKELMVLIGGGNDALKPMAVVLAATQAVNPKIPKEENSKAVMEMIKQVTADVKKGGSSERVLGDVTYTAHTSEITGLVFVMTPKK